MNDQYRNTQGNFTLAGKVFFLSSDPRADLSQSDREACGRDTHTSPWHRSTHLFLGQRPSAISLVWFVLKHWFKSCLQSGDSHWAIRLWEENLWASAAVLIFIISTFRPEFQTSIVFWFALTLQIHVPSTCLVDWTIHYIAQVWAQHIFKGTHGRSCGGDSRMIF